MQQSSVRLYLRFLTERGECPAHLVEGIPVLSARGAETMPRHLEPYRVEALIAACDPTTSAGKRDRAVLLLLARLGLRAGDIVAMRLGAVAWDEGSLRVCSKGRRDAAMPCWRHNWATGTPPSDCRRIAMICASVYLLVFIQNLLVHLGEKILLMQPLTFGGDY